MEIGRASEALVAGLSRLLGADKCLFTPEDRADAEQIRTICGRTACSLCPGRIPGMTGKGYGL